MRTLINNYLLQELQQFGVKEIGFPALCTKIIFKLYFCPIPLKIFKKSGIGIEKNDQIYQ